MSKLPIAAFYPGAETLSNRFQARGRNSTLRRYEAGLARHHINGTASIVKLADINTTSSPVVLCVDGVLLWLLIAWITAGTAAIITLIVKSCHNRWKHVEEQFDWGGLERSQPPTIIRHTRSKSCSSAPSICKSVATDRLSVASPSKFSRRALTRHTTSSRRTGMEDANRRHKSRSRRLQSTTA